MSAPTDRELWARAAVSACRTLGIAAALIVALWFALGRPAPTHTWTTPQRPAPRHTTRHYPPNVEILTIVGPTERNAR